MPFYVLHHCNIAGNVEVYELFYLFTDELLEIIDILESSAAKYIEALAKAGEISCSSTFQAITPDVSRFLLKQRKKYLAERGINGKQNLLFSSKTFFDSCFINYVYAIIISLNKFILDWCGRLLNLSFLHIGFDIKSITFCTIFLTLCCCFFYTCKPMLTSESIFYNFRWEWRGI